MKYFLKPKAIRTKTLERMGFEVINLNKKRLQYAVRETNTEIGKIFISLWRDFGPYRQIIWNRCLKPIDDLRPFIQDLIDKGYVEEQE